MARRTIAPKTSLCVDAGAASAEKRVALTLVDVCGEKGGHITAGASTATTAVHPSPQRATHHSTICLD